MHVYVHAVFSYVNFGFEYLHVTCVFSLSIFVQGLQNDGKTIVLCARILPELDEFVPPTAADLSPEKEIVCCYN